LDHGAITAKSRLWKWNPACFALLLALSACASVPPLSVTPGDPTLLSRDLLENALAAGTPSESTQIVLRRRDLQDLFDRDPAAAIAQLHDLIEEGEATADTLFALAELSYLLAVQLTPEPERAVRNTVRKVPRARRPRPWAISVVDTGHAARSHHLAAALYAWGFLFAVEDTGQYRLIDSRAMLAAALYNRALAAAFTSDEGFFEFAAGRRALPFGSLEVAFDPASLDWGSRRLGEFRPSAGFEVRGLRNRYRQPGIGAPLIAHAEPSFSLETPWDLQLARTVVSATAVLVPERLWAQLRTTEMRGTLRLYRGRDTSYVEFEGRQVPVAIDPSAALAATLEESGVWRGNLSAFLGRAVRIDRPPRLFALQPMLPNQTPVVFVHGTNSSPAVWANMVNDLLSDGVIREHFSFWLYAYDSGNPILYSGMNLRRSLGEIVETLSAEGDHPCLGDMIVIGHSQGGLLTRLTATNSGSRFWDSISSKPFDEVQFRPETRALLQEALFIETLPFVTRVVFISTPHHGSFLASPAIVRRLASRLIAMPANLVEVGSELAGLSTDASTELRVARTATSMDNMSPGNRFIRALAETPLAPEVAEHSIVAVLGDGPPEEGDDGVVRFSSAHRPEADSELVVRSDHSAQQNPHTINEVERILRLHAAESTCREGGERR
jgi:pimeloyl-ACP methyl ester carboxylesterase